jgi:hypothetical protein
MFYESSIHIGLLRKAAPAAIRGGGPNLITLAHFQQAFGEAAAPDKLERLGRYEVHLGRKLERMLTMLLRLKDLPRSAVG